MVIESFVCLMANVDPLLQITSGDVTLVHIGSQMSCFNRFPSVLDLYRLG